MANSSEPTPMNWHQKELLAALKRLVTARERLAALEEQAALPVVPVLDPADLQRADELHVQITTLRQKVSGFRGGRYRDELDGLEMQQRLVLDRLGATTYDELDERRRRFAGESATVVEPMVLEFARRELVAAEQAFLELQTMDVPDDEPEPEPVAEPAPEIDLRDAGTVRPSRTQSA